MSSASPEVQANGSSAPFTTVQEPSETARLPASRAAVSAAMVPATPMAGAAASVPYPTSRACVPAPSCAFAATPWASRRAWRSMSATLACGRRSMAAAADVSPPSTPDSTAPLRHSRSTFAATMPSRSRPQTPALAPRPNGSMRQGPCMQPKAQERPVRTNPS